MEASKITQIMTKTETAMTMRAKKLIYFRLTNVSRKAAVPVINIIISLLCIPSSSIFHEIWFCAMICIS